MRPVVVCRASRAMGRTITSSTSSFLDEQGAECLALRELTPAGFVVALNLDWTGPQTLYS